MTHLPVLISVFLGGVPESVFDNAGAWEAEETDGELKLEARPIEGSSWLEYRVITTTDVPVQPLCDSVFEQVTKGPGGPNVKQRKLLKDGADTRVLYDQVEAPMISKRDYAMTVRKLPADGVCRIRFKITNEEAPAVADGVVRMEKMWGAWVFEPRDGKTRITHSIYSDPAGSVPAFVARGSQKKAMKDGVRRMVANAARAGKDAGP